MLFPCRLFDIGLKHDRKKKVLIIRIRCPYTVHAHAADSITNLIMGVNLICAGNQLCTDKITFFFFFRSKVCVGFPVLILQVPSFILRQQLLHYLDFLTARVWLGLLHAHCPYLDRHYLSKARLVNLAQVSRGLFTRRRASRD